MITTEAEAKAAIERFTRVQRKHRFACPRCGAWAMAEDSIRNAISRYADVYVCDACGMDEAVRAFTGQPMPLTEWTIIQDVANAF